ncbi:MAG TPA: hypothetical protein VG425_09545 [Casimicrobiaceae bacterium]|jgi:hypothetical protein|nr:hypothetical protein [Casimicrobiaceae bacterium]
MKKLLLLVLLAFNGNANAVLQCYNDQGQDVTWTVGEIVPNFDTEPGVFVDCSANGNELVFIQQNFTGIRYARFRIVEWTGEDATFIYQNLEIQNDSGAAGSISNVKRGK